MSNQKLRNVLTGGDRPGKVVTLGIQHVFAMFGSTVLVPALTGLDPAVTLFCMGIGTLIFHLITKGIVPAFMGSSFSFIAAITAVSGHYGSDFIGYVGGGIIASGILYVLLAGLVKLFGAKRITSFFPPVVTGCMIIIIGMMLAPTAMSNITNVPDAFAAGTEIEIIEISDGYGSVKAGWIPMDSVTLKTEATQDAPAIYVADEDVTIVDAAAKDAEPVRGTYTWKYWVVAVFTVMVVVLVMFFTKGFISLVPILIGIVAGYLLSIVLGLVDFTSISNAAWFTLPSFTLPKFSWFAITMIAPISIVTFVEHVGDITANGAVTGHNYIESPGLHRTLLGCGLASVFSGLCGGPAATTYSENTGVLAATKNYNPATLRVAAVVAILLSFLGKVTGFLGSIPAPVMGGVSIVLFGMIASVGLRMLVENAVDFTNSRNLIIAAVMLVLGLGLSGGINIGAVSISGTAIAAVMGVILNKILPAEAKNAEKAANSK